MSYPIKFEHIYKTKVWGGNAIKAFLKRDDINEEDIGESWEIALHDDGTSIVENGKYKGQSLKTILTEHGREIFGSQYREYLNRFPLIIKYLDANKELSVQVHPDDYYAFMNEDVMDTGKTEMWYVLDAKEGSKIIYGLNRGVKKEEFLKAVKDKRLRDVMREIEIKKGDVIFLPSGTIHTLKGGALIAEVQQNSNLTYRIFDWDRLGKDGKERELHIDKAIDVINFETYIENPCVEGLEIIDKNIKRHIYVSCEKFTGEIVEIDGSFKCTSNCDTFEVLMCIDGEFEILYEDEKYKEEIETGRTVLIPANLEGFKIVGKGKLLRSYIIDPKEIVEELRNKNFSDSEILKISGIEKII